MFLLTIGNGRKGALMLVDQSLNEEIPSTTSFSSKIVVHIIVKVGVYPLLIDLLEFFKQNILQDSEPIGASVVAINCRC